MSVASVRRAQCPIERIDVCAYRIPTEDGPESDGTARWDASTMVLVEIAGGGETGIGYTYADAATARVVREAFSDLLEGSDALETGKRFAEMEAKIRNLRARRHRGHGALCC